MADDHFATAVQPLRACPECDLLQSMPTLVPGEMARCSRCGTVLARRRSDGARTNFYGAVRDNLHNYHLSDKGVTASCMSCHYDLHSNRSASNTQYRVVNGTTETYLGTAPPPNVKSHLVNFAPDVQGGQFALPRWQINTATGVRTCNLACHGENDKMAPVSYGPTAGDESSYTY